MTEIKLNQVYMHSDAYLFESPCRSAPYVRYLPIFVSENTIVAKKWIVDAFAESRGSNASRTASTEVVLDPWWAKTNLVLVPPKKSKMSVTKFCAIYRNTAGTLSYGPMKDCREEVAPARVFRPGPQVAIAKVTYEWEEVLPE